MKSPYPSLRLGCCVVLLVFAVFLPCYCNSQVIQITSTPASPKDHDQPSVEKGSTEYDDSMLKEDAPFVNNNCGDYLDSNCKGPLLFSPPSPKDDLQKGSSLDEEETAEMLKGLKQNQRNSRIYTIILGSRDEGTNQIRPFGHPQCNKDHLADFRVKAATYGAFWLDDSGLDEETGLQYYGQSREDKYLFEHFFRYPRPYFQGIYVELGATDGFKYSNTLFFHQALDWTGVLIEPSPSQFGLLRNVRRFDQLLNVAIAENEGYVDFLGDKPTGGVFELLEEGFRNRFHANKSMADTYKVRCGPIGKYLDLLGLDHIDLFSIDVEDSEIAVLKTMNWDIPVYVIVIELANRRPEKDEECRNILRDKGFVLYSRIPAYNEVWVNPQYDYASRRTPSYSAPYEVTVPQLTTIYL